MVMAAKLTRLTYKIAIQLHLVTVVTPGGYFGNFWMHPRTFIFVICTNIVRRVTAD